MRKTTFIGLAITVVMLFSSVIMTSYASIEDNPSGSNESSPGKAVPDENGFIGSGDPNHFNAGLEHIIQAQSALQNGDIEGTQNHLELAKQSFQTYCSACIKPVNPDIPIAK